MMKLGRQTQWKQEQWIRQVYFVKDAKRCTKKHGLYAKEAKDCNAFINGKFDKMLKEHGNKLHTMGTFKELLFSSSNKSIQSIVSNTSIEASDNEDHKSVAKK
eukprot:11296132-Ditylum_brightwellii.AAC.1